jgi:hypothetical protein
MSRSNVHINGGDTIYNSVVTANALEASAVVVTKPAILYTVFVTNTGPDQYLQFFDAVALPANGAKPLICIQMIGGYAGVLDVPVGRPFSTGIVVCNSTTQATKTIGAADCYFDVTYRRQPIA